MNRRKFFAGIAAAITATVIPIDFGDAPTTWVADPMTNIWWRAGPMFHTKIGAREIAALERAWKQCIIESGQHPSQICITDEQLMELGDE